MKKLIHFLISPVFLSFFSLLCFLILFVDLFLEQLPFRGYIFVATCAVLYNSLSDWYSSKSQEASK